MNGPSVQIRVAFYEYDRFMSCIKPQFRFSDPQIKERNFLFPESLLLPEAPPVALVRDGS